MIADFGIEGREMEKSGRLPIVIAWLQSSRFQNVLKDESRKISPSCLKYIALEQSSKESYKVGGIVFRLYTDIKSVLLCSYFPNCLLSEESRETPLIDL